MAGRQAAGKARRGLCNGCVCVCVCVYSQEPFPGLSAGQHTRTYTTPCSELRTVVGWRGGRREGALEAGGDCVGSTAVPWSNYQPSCPYSAAHTARHSSNITIPSHRQVTNPDFSTSRISLLYITSVLYAVKQGYRICVTHGHGQLLACLIRYQCSDVFVPSVDRDALLDGRSLALPSTDRAV